MTDSPSLPSPPAAEGGAGVIARVVVVAVVVSAVVVAAGVMGDRAGRADASSGQREIVAARLQTLERLRREAADADRDAAAQRPTIEDLKRQEAALEADNAALLSRLRAHAETSCAAADTNDVLRLEAAKDADLGLKFAEGLRQAFPCGVPAEQLDMGYEKQPTVTLDVVDFGAAVVGPCQGARLVRISLRCSYTEFEQDCDGGVDECAPFREPKPQFDWDPTWGCIRTGPGGRESLAAEGECHPDEVDQGPRAEVSEAHLYWLMTAHQAIYLQKSSSGWPDLSDAEVAPGQRLGVELSLAVRADSDVIAPTWSFPDRFAVNEGALFADGDIHLDVAHIGDEGRRDFGEGFVGAPTGGGRWRVTAPDGTNRIYTESLDLTQDFTDVEVADAFVGDGDKAGVVFGDEYVCQRRDDAPPQADDPRYTRVGTRLGGGVYVEGKPVSGAPLPTVLWQTPFGEAWPCTYRGAAPYPSDIDDPPWVADVDDETREQLRWCFQ